MIRFSDKLFFFLIATKASEVSIGHVVILVNELIRILNVIKM